MRRTPSSVLAAVAIALLATAVTTVAGLGLAAPASATPTVTLAGSSSHSALGTDELITFRYTISTQNALPAASLTLAQAASLPVDASSFRLDGHLVSAVSSAYDLGSLTIGSHTATFTATVPATVTADPAAQSSATFTYTDGGVAGQVVSTAVTTPVNEPDVSLTFPPDSGQDQIGLLGTGNLIGLAAVLTNNGFGSPNTDFVIDQPTGVAVVPDFVFRSDSDNPLSCTPDSTAPSKLICPVGSLHHGESIFLIVGFTTTSAAQVGGSATIAVSGQAHDPALVDQTPGDNSKQATVSFTGIAHLTYSIQPSTTKVSLGRSVTVTLTVHNQGPQPAVQTFADVFIDDSHFSVQHFDGVVVPSDGSTVTDNTSGSGASSAFGSTTNAGRTLGHVSGLWKPTRSFSPSARTNRSGPASKAMLPASINAAPSAGTNISASSAGASLVWNVGTLQPGQTATTHLILKATTLGKLLVGLTAQSAAGDPQCASLLNPNADPSGCFALRSDVTAVQAAAVRQPASSVSHPAAATASTLAATGGPIGPALIFGVMLVMVGGGALHLGRQFR